MNRIANRESAVSVTRGVHSPAASWSETGLLAMPHVYDGTRGAPAFRLHVRRAGDQRVNADPVHCRRGKIWRIGRRTAEKSCAAHALGRLVVEPHWREDAVDHDGPYAEAEHCRLASNCSAVATKADALAWAQERL